MKADSVILLAWKKLQVARKNCSDEIIFHEVTLTHISLNYCAIIITQQLFFIIILCVPTKSFKVKNWNKSKIRSSNKFLQLISLSIAQSVCFFNSSRLYHESRRLVHTVANVYQLVEKFMARSAHPFWHAFYAVTLKDVSLSSRKSPFVACTNRSVERIYL